MTYIFLVRHAMVVAHKTLIRLTLCSLLGILLIRYRSIFPVVNNAALTEIRFRSQDVALMQYNSPLDLLLEQAALKKLRDV